MKPRRAITSTAQPAALVPDAPSTPGVHGVPPPPRAARTACGKHLWYAAIFPPWSEPQQADAALRRLSLHAQAFTSLVSIEPPDALLLEIKGSLRLLGPLARLHAAIDARWRELGLEARSATAPSTLAALWCARAGEQILIEDPAALAGRLSQLPIACTAWDEERLRTLRAMGLRHLGEVLRLPRAGLARRLGQAAVRELDVALARLEAPRRAFVPRERFRERCDFETEIEHVAALAAALAPVIARCADFLRARQSGVQRLELRLRHRSAPVLRVRLGLSGITSERRRLADVLENRLLRLELAAPVRGFELLSGSLQPLSAASLDAFAGFGNGTGRDTAAQLVERLRARLGERAVYGISSIPEHRPEAAWRRVHPSCLAAARAAARAADNESPDEGMPRPLWLLEEPLRLRHDSWTVEQGPERIESGWWDGKGVTRDYYVMRRADGARLWVFQERHDKLWYLHGVFS